MLNYVYTIRDKVSENKRVMNQIANNSREQALLGDFPAALNEAVLASGEAHQNQMMQYLNSAELRDGLQKLVLDLLVAQNTAGGEASGPRSRVA